MSPTLGRRLLVVAAVSVAVLALPMTGFAGHSWGNYHWARTANPFTLQLGDNMTTDWDTYLRTAASDWNQSTVMDNPVVAGQSSKRCGATAGRVEVCNGTYGQNGWLGLAQIWLSNGHISQGVAKMNDTYFAMATYNNPSEKLHVVCQEIGHTFGLGHTSEDGTSQNTCMDYYQNKINDGISTHPNQHDYDQLKTIYSHLDSFNSAYSVDDAPVSAFGVSPTVPFMLPPALTSVDTSEFWGREIFTSNDGRFSVYELDFGHDHKILTHVFWAEDHQDDRLDRRPAKTHGE